MLRGTETILITEKLLAVAIFLQTLEFLQIHRAFSEIWRWDILKEDEIFRIPLIQITLGPLLKTPAVFVLLILRLLLAILVLSPWGRHFSIFIFPSLLLLSILLGLRWRGNYNGGSDAMTTLILLALNIAVLFHTHSSAIKACLWLISLQVCLSYWLAGIAKLRHGGWRKGKTLALLLTKTNYEVPEVVKTWVRKPALSLTLSWIILIFECSFPLALFRPQLCLIYIGLALVFHLANFFAFGLNRFVLAWLAAYPALYWSSHWLRF